MGLRRLGVLILAAVLLRPAPAAAQAQLLARVAGIALGQVVSDTLPGVFGLGGGSDPAVRAKLDQIIGQLQVVQGDVTQLKADVSTLTNTVVAQSNLIQLQSLLHDMDDASTRIQLCAQQVMLVAQAPGTDAADQPLYMFALQMVGRQAGPCDLTSQFSIIHARIVTNQVLGSTQSAFYDLLARAARDNGIAYERVASHFVQYAIIQREALDLIRGAYTL